MSKRRNENKRAEELREDAEKFAKATFKKYYKKNKDYGMTKKECKAAYFDALMEVYPNVAEWVLRYGFKKNDAEIPSIKEAIYAKFTDPWFIKKLTKRIKNGDTYDNIKLLPIMLREVLMIAAKLNKDALAADPNASVYELDDVISLSKLIMKKRLKKFVAAGIDEDVAFNVLSVIPTPASMSYSPNYRIFQFFDVLYEASKAKDIQFPEIMSLVVDEDRYPGFIVFALLERKEKYGNLTDNQKKFYLSVTNWLFATMEKSDRRTIEIILEGYVRGRKQDDAQGKDGNRRYTLSSLEESEYPRTVKLIKNMILNDESVKKYF